MIGSKISKFAILTLVAFAAWLLAPVSMPSDTVLNTSPAAAQSDPCAAANFARSLGRTAASLGADQQQMAKWCKEQQQREASLAAKPADGASASKGPTQLKAEPKVAEIWCGKNNCLCWKGKLYNGCTNLAACSTKLKCAGTICGCTTK